MNSVVSSSRSHWLKDFFLLGHIDSSKWETAGCLNLKSSWRWESWSALGALIQSAFCHFRLTRSMAVATGKSIIPYPAISIHIPPQAQVFGSFLHGCHVVVDSRVWWAGDDGIHGLEDQLLISWNPPSNWGSPMHGPAIWDINGLVWGKNYRKAHFSLENLWFPVCFPYSQSIDSSHPSRSIVTLTHPAGPGLTQSAKPGKAGGEQLAGSGEML